MKRSVLVLAIMMGSLFFAEVVLAASVNVKVYPTKQAITFPVTNGRVTGLIMRSGEAYPRLDQIKEIQEQSDRVGYNTSTTIAKGIFSAAAKGAIIINTCNNDKAL